MDTLRSNSEQKYLAGASLFSGRPDPTWELDPAVAAALEAIWATLEPTMAKAPTPPPLGYRGCFLKRGTDREWFAYGGVVSLHSGTSVETRSDPERRFEKELLATAPPGLPFPEF